MLSRLRLATIRAPVVPSLPADLRFWLCFLTLNALPFLPLYLLNLENTTFWPLTDLAGDSALSWGRLLRRENFDLFRVQVEMALLVAIWLNVAWMRGRAYRYAFIVFYFVALYYAFYESASLALYQEEPNFFNQYRFFVDGGRFLLTHLHLSVWAYVAAIAGLIFVHLLIVWLATNVLVELAPGQVSRGTVMMQGTVAALGLVALLYFRGGLANPEMEFSSLGLKLQQNIASSIENYRKAARIDDMDIRQIYQYDDYALQSKPNIYLIFIESYGSVLYKRPDYREQYTALLDELWREVEGDGWQAATALSEAPTWGGGSWMSYTSALFGLRIDTHPQYLALLNKYQNEAYPDLGRYLQGQGYRHYRLSSLADEMDDLEWARYQNFYGVDEWLRYRDLGYHGSRYGWGPAPPDQYALHFARDTIQQQTDGPFLFFFITQNSHYPFYSLPPLADDWRSLDAPATTIDLQNAEEIAHETKRQNYFNAIEYELRMLVDFVQTSADENALFVLVGDHQPPQVSRRADGWDTPMHIISRDEALIDSLAEYGFVDGLRVHNLTPAIKHEGFYSLMVRVLLSNYGENVSELPAYRPDGFVIEEAAVLQ